MTIATEANLTLLTIPVYDLREDDVFVGTGGTIIKIDAPTPWKRIITERRDGLAPTQSQLECADEVNIYRRIDPTEFLDEEIAAQIPKPTTNTQRLAGIRCPQCSHESAFVVQITLNVVMLDEGHDIFGCEEPPADHFPGRVIDSEDGFFDDDPIQCYQRRGGCGHRGTVSEFRITEEASAASNGA